MPSQRVEHRLPTPLRAQLEQLAARHRVSVDAVLAGAWAVVLGRHLAADQLVAGGAGPVRLDWQQPVAAWLAGLPDPHSPRPGPAAATGLEAPAAATDPESPAAATSLESIVVALAADRQSVQARYDPTVVTADLARRLLAHLAAALASLATATVLDDVDLVPPGERALLAARAVPRADFPPGTAGLLPARFADWAARTPGRIAVRHGDRAVSYGDLCRRVARLAHRLHQLGAAPGRLVGICLPRGIDLITAVLAAACAGAGYLPVDRRDPTARLRSVLADAAVAVLVTERAVVEALADPGAADAGADNGDAGPTAALPPVVALDDPAEADRLARLSPRLPALAATADDPAYVIYTSGSTGAPKGVVVEHAQLCRLFDATAEWFGFGPDDVWTLFHSIAFDFSVWELWGALGHGGQLVVVPESTARDPGRFRQLLLDHRVSVLNQTPASFHNLVEADLAAGPAPAPYALRQVIFGGDRLDPASLRPWLERYGDQRPRLTNMYGITETTVHVTYRPISMADLVADSGSSPIGVPIPDLAVRLVDSRGRLVPIGVPGEIEVTGAGVARGYLNRPELTSQRFVTVAGPAGPQRWYRTGDRARWLPNGELEYLGRLDNQVKVRGYRIELGEIESVLSGHPQVRQAAVTVRQVGPRHHQLVAYLVLAPGAELSWAQLRGWLAQRLPEHLIPAAAVSLARLPLTPNGKLDRAALPEPTAEQPDHGYVAAGSQPERVLAEVVAEVLQRDRVGVNDNFFALGGDSILAIQVAVRARARGVSVTPAQLFTHQSVAALAEVAVPATATSAEQGEVTGDVPPTAAQAWFHWRDLPHPGHWPLPVLLVAAHPVRVDRLRQALTGLVAHHDLLRLRVDRTSDGRVRQWIAPVAAHGPVPVQEIDLTPVDPSQRERRIAALTAGSPEPDLATGPLLRAIVLRVAGAPDRVLLVAHHLVVDAVSWQILVADLDTAYRQVAGGEPVVLPAKTTDVGQWARQLRELANSEQTTAQAGWWLTMLPPQPPALPHDGDPQAPNLEGDRAVVALDLAETTTEALLTSANQAYRTRADELVVAGLARAFAEGSGVPQLLCDMDGHGRDLPVPGTDVSRTVGWFTTITPTWLDLSDVDIDDPAALIKAVKEQLRAVPGRGAPYCLARWLREDSLAEQLAALPAAQVSFNHLGRLDPAPGGAAEFAPAPEPVNGAGHPDNPRSHLIDVVTGVAAGRLRLYLAYSTRHHKSETMRRLAERFRSAVRALVAHCQSPGAGGATPSDFPLAQVDQDQLDSLTARHGRLADLYPLAPLQRGLLFHTLADPHSGVYFEQFSIDLAGELAADTFVRAWHQLQQRHDVLRAAVAWQGLPIPHLVIRHRAELPLHRYDWRQLPEPAQQQRLAELLAADRTEGFDLARAPLTRLRLIRLAAQRWHLVWSHHHLLLDRWSVAKLIEEVFDTYRALRAGRYEPPPPPRPFRDYIAYLAGLDLSGAPAYWRRVLSGITEPTPLRADRPPGRAGRRDADYARLAHRLTESQSEAVRQFARANQITLDTILHGAWALLLAHRSGRDDVVFAVTSSGRPPQLAGVEEMIGLFINTLPARVRIEHTQPVSGWLAGLMRDQAQAREFEHTPLERIRGYSMVPADQPLFETGRALVNFPWDGSRYQSGQLRITGIRTFEQASYAVTFLAVPERSLELQVWYDARRFEPTTAEQLLQTAARLVVRLVADPDRRLASVLAELPPASAGLPGAFGATDPDLGPARARLQALPAVREVLLRITPDRRALTAQVTVDVSVLDRDGELVERLGAAHLARGSAPSAGQAALPPDPDRFRWLLGDRSTAPRVLVIDSGSDLLPELLAGSRGATDGDYDLVVLDRVVAGLPGPVHLARLVDGALSLTAPTGALLLTGVPGLAPREADPEDHPSRASADSRSRPGLARPEPLRVDPAYFTALAADDPRVEAAAALIPPPDATGAPNATASPDATASPGATAGLGYDAVVWRLAPAPPKQVGWYDWQRDVLSASELEWLLHQADGDAVGISGAPHGLAAARQPARLRSDAADPARQPVHATTETGVDPAQLYHLARRLGWSVTVARTPEPGQLDILFRRGTGHPPGPLSPPSDHLPEWELREDTGRAPAALTNRPLYADLVDDLTRQVRQVLAETLPEYVDATTVTVCDTLPPAPALPMPPVPPPHATAPPSPTPPAAAPPTPPAPAPLPVTTSAVPPRNPAERALAQVWCRVLRISTVDVRASFFDLGGDSMLAIRLVDEATRSLGYPVPLALLLQHPTIEQMAEALAAQPRAASPVIELHSGHGTPFFCAHPAGGTVLSYQELSQLIGPRTFYALQARGIDDAEPPDHDLPTMATRFLAAVRDWQPTGPYLLGGWSMGGLIAYEMAQQLVAAGERVRMLVLIDTPAPELIGEPPDPAGAMARLLDGVAPIDLDALRAMPAAARLPYVLAEAQRVGRVPPGIDPRRAEQMFAVYLAHLDAVRDYRPRRYDGPVRLLRALDSGVSVPDYGWGELLTGDWRRVDVPGDHESMMWPPHVARLGQVLREQLDPAG